MIAFAILYYPMFDGVRVFALRASRGISPLKADRTHLHYYLLDAGYTHSKSVVIILATNLLIIAVGYLMQNVNVYITLLAMTVLASVILWMIYRLRERKMNSSN